MADFTGMTVKVTLKAPSSMMLQGRVQHIVPGQLLTLQDVYFLHNGTQCKEYSIRGPLIADLQVVDPNASPAVPTTAPPLSMPLPDQLPPIQPASQVPTGLPTSVTPQRNSSSFVDPAILSYGRSPAQAQPLPKPPEPATPVKSMLAKAAETLPANASPFIGEAGKNSGSIREGRPRDAGHVARQPSAPQVHVTEGDGIQETGEGGTATKKKTRRSQKKKPLQNTQDPPPVMDVEVSRNGNDMNGTVKRGKGWRQTPLLQPSPQTSSPHNLQPTPKARKKKETPQNGWATEDATDIQDLGDFDFEASNNLFDKAQVFSELRQGDTTADEDRLVSHNKVYHKPGTYGGKNLHPTENVLSPTLGPADSSSDADTELNFPNGRSSSRHSISRAAIRKGPSRQNSAQVDGGGRAHPLSASLSSDRGGMARSATSLSNKVGKTVPSIATSPMPIRTKPPISAVPTARMHPTILEPHFVIKSNLSPCPVLLPSALETLETETISRYGLTAEAIAETAARSIAETAMRMFLSNSRRPSRANTIRASSFTTSGTLEPHAQPSSPEPVIVIIAGNHAFGARAIAAARHLHSRNAQIIIAEAQYDGADMQEPQMKTQLAMLRRMVKSGASIKRGPWRRASNFIKNLSGPPSVIVDALLAGSTYDSLVENTANAQYAENAQRETREMIEWANRSRAPVLSIGCPSGVSGLDGSAPVMEGEPLAVRPDKVLSLGAPMQGLLDAAKGGEKWDVALADIGINITLRKDEAVAFGAQWIVDVAFASDVGGGG